jgi:8-oxo-dGTP diphosphatase
MLSTSKRGKKNLFSKTEYVVGFAFSENEKYVILIRKQRPEWQKGSLNGPGGHIEDGEGMYGAMAREFKEEVGIDTLPLEWVHKVTVEGKGWRVYFLTIMLSDNKFASAKTMTDEMISIVPVGELFKYTMISNLRWLIPYCLYKPDLDEKVSYIGG